MSESKQQWGREFPSVDQAMLDRLVDGELGLAELSQVVDDLDRSPDGWKRCALAFLEAQALRHDLECVLRADCSPNCEYEGDASRRLAAATDSLANGNPYIAGRDGRPVAIRWTWLLAVAACGLISFLLGLAVPDGRSPSGRDQVQQAPREGSPEAPREIPHDDPAPSPSREMLATGGSPGAADPVGNLRLQFEDAVGSQGQQVNLPVYELSENNARWLSQPAEVPPAFVQAARQMGSRVERQQGFLPVPLENGEQILVPIEQVEIVPVGGRMFQ